MTETCGGSACIAWPLAKIRDRYLQRQELKREIRIEELERKEKNGELTPAEKKELEKYKACDFLESIFDASPRTI